MKRKKKKVLGNSDDAMNMIPSKTKTKLSKADKEFLVQNPALAYVLSYPKYSKDPTAHKSVMARLYGDRLKKEAVGNTKLMNNNATFDLNCKPTFLNQCISDSCSPGPIYNTSKCINKAKAVKFSKEERFSTQTIQRQCKKKPSSDVGLNAGIYALHNPKTGHMYFGSSWDLFNAKHQNYKELEAGSHEHKGLVRTSQAYGSKHIHFRILQEIQPKEGFNYREFEEVLHRRREYHRNKAVKSRAAKVLLVWRVGYFQHFWPIWKSVVASDVRVETEAAAIEIQRISRGYLGKKIVVKTIQHCASTKIQSLWRGHLGRHCAEKRRIHLNHLQNAKTIQNCWKNYLQRKIDKRRRNIIRKCIKTKVIQRVWRGYFVRTRVAAVEKDKLSQKTSSILIQSTFRGFASRRRLYRLEQLSLRNKASVCIQKNWRRYFAENYQIPLVYEKYQESRKQTKAAVTIQTYYLYYLERKFKYNVDLYVTQNRESKKLGIYWKNYVARKFGWTAVTYKLEMKMAVRIQRMYHAFVSRKNLRLMFRQIKEYFAAVLIQSIVRGFIDRRITKKMKLNLCAIKIQKCWKCFVARKMLRIARRHRIETKMATKIQSSIRGYLTRKRFKILLENRKREVASLKIQSQWRVFVAKKKFARKVWLLKNDPCKHCEDELASLHCLVFQLNLCKNCFNVLIEWETQYCSDDELNNVLYCPIPLKEYYLQTRMSIKIQSLYRGYQSRQLLKNGRCDECSAAVKRYCHNCCSKLCYICSTSLHDVVISFKNHAIISIDVYVIQTNSAISIQKNVRRMLAYRKVSGIRLAKQVAAVKVIQHVWICYQFRVLVYTYSEKRKIQKDLEENSAKDIQRVYRGFVARNSLRTIKRRNQAAAIIQKQVRIFQVLYGMQMQKQAVLKNEAAIKIQSTIRGKLARIKFQQIRENIAAAKIQCWVRLSQLHWRVSVTRDKFQNTAKELKIFQITCLQNAAMIKIQCSCRQYLARKLFSEKLYDKVSQLRICALQQILFSESYSAMKIQRCYRTRLFKLNDCCTIVQSIARMFIHRRVFLKVIGLRLRREEKSCKIIQKCYRDYVERKEAAVLASSIQNNGSSDEWQECWDDNQQSWYYYNTFTGESAWTKPDTSENWVEYWDETQNAPYFYNNVTGETTWERPTSFQASYNNVDVGDEYTYDSNEYYDTYENTSYHDQYYS